MSKDFYKIPCIFLIIVFLFIIGYATYINFTYENTDNEIKNDIANTTLNNENNEINQNTDKTTTDTNTLSCNKTYIEEEYKSNINESIDVSFIDNEPVNQNIIKIYTFENKEDYDAFITNNPTDGNQAYNTNEENNTIEVKDYNDYTTPYNSNNKMDFRDMDYDEIKEALENNNYICG